jgi:hypothetical protein
MDKEENERDRPDAAESPLLVDFEILEIDDDLDTGMHRVNVCPG